MRELTTVERETLMTCREPQLLSAIPAPWQAALGRLRSLGMIDVTRIDRSRWYETTFLGCAALAGQPPELAVEHLVDAAPALFLACKKALAVLGTDQIGSPFKKEDAKRFDAVLHLTAAIAQAEGREADRA